MLNIKEKIEFWQGMYSNEFCRSQKEMDDSAAELELVLFAIETLTNTEVK